LARDYRYQIKKRQISSWLVYAKIKLKKPLGFKYLFLLLYQRNVVFTTKTTRTNLIICQSLEI
jgi:hypothetical protein